MRGLFVGSPTDGLVHEARAGAVARQRGDEERRRFGMGENLRRGKVNALTRRPAKKSDHLTREHDQVRAYGVARRSIPTRFAGGNARFYGIQAIAAAHNDSIRSGAGARAAAFRPMSLASVAASWSPQHRAPAVHNSILQHRIGGGSGKRF